MKKKILSISLIATAIFFVFLLTREIGICPDLSYSSCGALFDSLAEILIPTVTLFIFSLIAYFTPEQIFKSWAKFAVVWVPLSTLAILVAPEYSGDFLFPIEKGSVALLTTIVFAVCSFLLIGWGYWKVTSKK